MSLTRTILGLICALGISGCLDDPQAPGCPDDETLHPDLDQCVPICNSDDDCGSGEACQSNGICGPECLDDTHCTNPPNGCHEGMGTCGAAGCEYGVRDGSGCDDGDLCTESDLCDEVGACAGSAKVCPPLQECNPDNGECEVTENEGRGVPCDPDARDPGCLGELICDEDNDRCCEPEEDCCLNAADCPEDYSDDSLCVVPGVCEGRVETAICEEGWCVVTWQADETGEACDGEICNPGTSFACRAGACATVCDSETDDGCPDGFACVSGSGCQPPAGLGVACPDASDCDGYGLVCVAGNQRLCCIDGYQCCNDWSDCTLQDNQVELDRADPETCDGWSRTLTCDLNRCLIVVDDANDSGCDDEICRDGSCEDAMVIDPSICDAGLCPPEGDEYECPNDFDCQDDGGFCWDTCEADYARSDRCAWDTDQADHYCYQDVCYPLLRISDPCSDNGQCLSEYCDGAPSGTCRGAPGELCVPFPFATSLDRCVPILPGHPHGLCGPASPDGQLGRCFNGLPECLDPCSFWEGDEWSGGCTGRLNDFTSPRLGLTTALCYDDGGGSVLHDFSCENDFDDDGDGEPDWEDPDCISSFWDDATTTTPARQVRAACETPVLDGLQDEGPAETICSTCASGIGGCFDEFCHAYICWPESCVTRFAGREVVLCAWWDSHNDTEDTCEPAFTHQRPAAAPCAYGMGCTCHAGGPEEWDCHNGSEYDFGDDDFDGFTDGADPDCRKDPGDPCVMRSQRTWSDQCGNAAQTDDDLCWCSDADCWVGVCIAGGDCPGDNDECKFYPNANDVGCGTPTNRPDYSPVDLYDPTYGFCLGGVITALGSAAPEDTCTDWWQCASGVCGCANAACDARVCWDVVYPELPGDCDWEPCFYRTDGTCATTGVVDLGTPCFDPEIGPSDCVCIEGFPREGDCDDGMSTDTYYDDSIDWWDRTDCHDAWIAGLRDRLRPGE